MTARQLETAEQRYLVKCAAAQPRSLEGTLCSGGPKSKLSMYHILNRTIYPAPTALVKRKTSNTHYVGPDFYC